MVTKIFVFFDYIIQSCTVPPMYFFIFLEESPSQREVEEGEVEGEWGERQVKGKGEGKGQAAVAKPRV